MGDGDVPGGEKNGPDSSLRATVERRQMVDCSDVVAATAQLRPDRVPVVDVDEPAEATVGLDRLLEVVALLAPDQIDECSAVDGLVFESWYILVGFGVDVRGDHVLECGSCSPGPHSLEEGLDTQK